MKNDLIPLPFLSFSADLRLPDILTQQLAKGLQELQTGSSSGTFKSHNDSSLNFCTYNYGVLLHYVGSVLQNRYERNRWTVHALHVSGIQSPKRKGKWAKRYSVSSIWKVCLSWTCCALKSYYCGLPLITGKKFAHINAINFEIFLIPFTISVQRFGEYTDCKGQYCPGILGKASGASKHRQS